MITARDFYQALQAKESGGLKNPAEVENKARYVGLYQMGEQALEDAGYYVKDNKHYNNDWTGKWTGKNGINSLKDFKAHPEVQEKAIRAYHKKVWGYLKDYHKYEGKVIKGITLTKSGMIAATHLVGKGNAKHPGFKNFIESDGTVDPKDGNGVSSSTYLRDLGGMKVDWLEGGMPQNQLESIVIRSQSSQRKAVSTTISNIYEVKTGDNLSAIARKQGKTVNQLLAIPGNEQFKANPNAIKPGDKVNLGEARAPEQNTQPQSDSVPIDQII